MPCVDFLLLAVVDAEVEVQARHLVLRSHAVLTSVSVMVAYIHTIIVNVSDTQRLLHAPSVLCMALDLGICCGRTALSYNVGGCLIGASKPLLPRLALRGLNTAGFRGSVGMAGRWQGLR